VNPVSDIISQRLSAEVGRLSGKAITVSREIHQNPELAFREQHAARLLTAWLGEEGFAVERGIAGLETAFRAVRGSGEPAVAYLLEYDALPDLGHGCGHNLIAAGGAAAAIALARTLDGPGSGTVQVIGTPAEEDGGGKIIELEAGVFDGLTAAMMFHPADRTLPTRRALACIDYKLTYHGVAAHAAKNPHDGVNALAAMIQFFVALDGMRQQLDPRARVHGIITKGGSAANIIPDLTEASFIVRHVTGQLTRELAAQAENCARAAALATGATCELRHSSPMYEERNDNPLLAERAGRYMAEAGLDVKEPSDDDGAGSSDIGNVSQRLPCIHPYVQIAPDGTPGHSIEMREAAASDAGHQAALAAAIALARVGADLLTDSEFRDQVRAEFEMRT
jgi:amidohydrolase